MAKHLPLAFETSSIISCTETGHGEKGTELTFLNIYHKPGSVLSVLYLLPHLNLISVQ